MPVPINPGCGAENRGVQQFLSRRHGVEVKFHRDVNHNYMMLMSSELPDPDAYENRVILANRIRGLLPCRLLYLNGDTFYSYEITSMQSLEILRGRRILSGDGFSGFLYELIDVLCGLEEYLLDFDHLILTPDKIFIDPSGEKIGLVYFPAHRKDIKESMRELIEYLLSGTDPDDRRTMILGYKVYHALQKDELLLGELRGILSGSGDRTDTPERAEQDRFPGQDETGSGQKNTGMRAERIGDRIYEENFYDPPETGRAERGKRHFIKAGKGTVQAVVVFLITGLLSAAVTYAFLHLGLGRILSEHSDFLIRIGGACAVLALFAAALHFAGKSRRAVPCPAGLPEEGSLRSAAEKYPEDNWPGEWADPGGSRADLPAEAEGPVKDPDLKDYPRETGEGEYTCLLRKEQKASGSSAKLVPEGSCDGGELTEIGLGEGTVIIGKNRELADRVIPRAAVSRVHARIRFSEGTYFLMDLNSRNGTFLNGELLPGGEEAEMSAGDRILFADAEYRFCRSGEAPKPSA